MLENKWQTKLKLRSGSIKFNNLFNQLAVLFKICADFECKVKGVRGIVKNSNTSYTEKYQAHIPFCFAYKVVFVNDKFSKLVLLYRRKNALNRFIRTIFRKNNYWKKMIKEHLEQKNKNLVMSQKGEKIYFNQVISAGYVINYLT